MRRTAHFFKHQPPGWSGCMQSVTVGSYPGKSSATMLPIVNLNPCDSCIYSTLCFISVQACKLKITSPCVRFDQPLLFNFEKIGIVI